MKSCSPKKPLTTNSPRTPKKQQKKSPRRKKLKKQINPRRRNYISSSDSDSDSDVTVELDDDDCDSSDDDGKDLDLDEYIKRLQMKEKAKENKISDETLNAEELNMQLDTLPIYIRSADDEDIEIELIDYLNCNDGAKTTKSEKNVAQAKVMPLPNIGFQHLDDTVPIENTDEQPGPSTGSMASLSTIMKNDDDIFKKPSRIIQKVKAKPILNQPQPSTSKETMEIINKSNNITTNLKKNSPEKANENTDTPARVTGSLSNDISPENNTDTPARITRSRSKDMSPEVNINEPKAKSKDVLSTSKEMEPKNKNSSPKNSETPHTNNEPTKEFSEKRTKHEEEDCIVQLPEDIPRNRKPLSSTTPIHIGDVDMIEKYVPIHGRTKRILWNKQDPEVGKSFRGSSFTISAGTINSIDSVTTVYQEGDENLNDTVNNKSLISKEQTKEGLADLSSTTGDKNNMESNENTQMRLPDLDQDLNNGTEKSDEKTKISLLDLNSSVVSTIPEPNENRVTKRLLETPKNTEVPAKKYKTSIRSVQAINSIDIANTADGVNKRTRSASSDKSLELTNLDNVEDMVRVTRSSKVSPEKKKNPNDSFDDPEVSALTMKLKKPEKREQKQIHRKSKFKRMGIMEIADLNNDRRE